ncbi:MAG: hypothetical protein F4Y84_05685 [Caldilineaceae bacterium SB0665_bin_25]|nr:hypothetical protein [Caldilineaceae bacterium SB0665_bin_25]
MSLSKKLDYSTLFELSDPMAIEPFRLRSRLPSDSSQGGLDLDRLSQGAIQVSDPIQFDVAQGSGIYDFLWTQLVTPVCISKRVVRLLQKSDVSGWSTYPVEVIDDKGRLLADYHGLAVSGAICLANYTRSSVVTKSPPAPRGRSYDVYRGLYFDADEWDGSDMFWVGRVRVVVEKVKKIFEQNDVKNVCFTRLSEREIRVRHVQGN